MRVKGNFSKTKMYVVYACSYIVCIFLMMTLVLADDFVVKYISGFAFVTSVDGFELRFPQRCYCQLLHCDHRLVGCELATT